jgi:ADP-dependent NAD(P)H-hydrate dehydratase / NAD(P)H-hydrate epimerase
MQEYWLKQDVGKPLFPDVIWSRPENKQSAGKLLIVGGNTHGFIDVGLSYQASVKAGAGTVRVLLPDGLRKTVGATLENCEFAPTTPSGSFAKTALNELLIHADWADCVLLAGEFGRNSETAIMLESFVEKYSGPLVITRDAIDYFFNHSLLLLDRPDTCVVGSTAQIHKLAINTHYPRAITTTLDLVQLVEIMHDFIPLHKAYVITHQLGTTIVAAENKISTTKTGTNEDIWRIPTAATAAVFWMQNFGKPFEAISTSLVDPGYKKD